MLLDYNYHGGERGHSPIAEGSAQICVCVRERGERERIELLEESETKEES